MLKKRLLEFFLTFGYIGKIKYCPGTLASIATVPFTWLVVYAIMEQVMGGNLDFFTNLIYPILDSWLDINLGYTFILFVAQIIFLAFIIILLIAGILVSSYYIKRYSDKQDPQEIVIDEVVGQMLTLFLCFPGFMLYPNILFHYSRQYLGQYHWIALFILPVILFRIFDIFKPWPISYIDQNVKGGLGVMLDDIVAAIFASIAFYVILLPLHIYAR